MASEIDIRELANMIRNKRGTRGLRVVAKEIGDVSASTLSRIEQGKVPDLDTFIKLCKWLGVSADHFTKDIRDEDIHESTPQIITAHLRADRTLDPQTADALVTMIEMAYNAVDRGLIGKQKGKNATRVQNMG
jgi:transcriptional regulator with XRE-family HTH domain